MKKLISFIKQNKIMSAMTAILIVFSIAGYIMNGNDKKAPKVTEDIHRAVEGQVAAKELITIEIGSELPSIQEFLSEDIELEDDAIIKYYAADEEISIEKFCEIKNKKYYTNKLGEYKVRIVNGNKEYKSTLKVADTTKPEVETKDVIVSSGDAYTPKDFIESYKDNSNSNVYSANYIDNSQVTLVEVGEHEIKLTVCDESSNCTDVSAKLIIKERVNPGTGGNGGSGGHGGSSQKPPSGGGNGGNGGNGGSSGGNGGNGGNSGSGNEQKPKITNQDVEEKVVLTSESKYGTQNNTFVMVLYHYDENGNKTEVRRSEVQSEIIYSTYNGTTQALKAEAIQEYNNQGDIRSEILNKVNEYRSEVGANPLTIDYHLSVMATIRSMEMAISNTFSHTRPGNKSWDTVWDEYGYPRGQLIGENVAKGYTNPASVCNGWRNSQGHYANMINTTFTKIGIGKYKYTNVIFWAQEFSS